MTRDEILTLLQQVASYDGRKVDGLVVGAWSRAAELARWDSRAASDSVDQHYANSKEWLMPGHVTELIRQKSRQPAPASEVLALEAAPPASPERRAEFMAQIRNMFSKGTE